MKDVARNRKAYRDFAIDDTYEAGLVLVGTEVKSLRDGRADLSEGYVTLRDGEAFLVGARISPYTHGNIQNHEPTRTRKLLLHKREIAKLHGKVQQKGYALVPLRIFFKGSHAKLEFGLGKGKRFFEKRETIKERDARKEIDRAVKSRARR